MELISDVVIIVMAVWAGWHLRGLIFMAAISENPDQIIKMLEEIKKLNSAQPEATSTDDAVILNVEEMHGVVYLFQAENDRFVGQGATIEQALTMARERFPNKKFWTPSVTQDNQTA